MEFQKLAYDLCRCYVEDHRGLVDDCILNRILGWVRSRDIAHLSSCSDHFPEAFQQLEINVLTRQVAAFFKKNACFSEPTVCEPAAELAFKKAERICRITNKRLEHYFPHHMHRLKPRLERNVWRVERIITDVLGDFDGFLAELPQRVRVTTGASSTANKRSSLPYLKIGTRRLPATIGAQKYLKPLARFFGHQVTFRTVVSNRVETVPKNWKTDRTIACEPIGNLPLQLALDDYIKDRLRLIGVDLSSQFRNQQMAEQASIADDYATIDLSMASDTVALNCVAMLLPVKWYQYANDCRSPFGKAFGSIIKYAKFSSMGNGSTFTIETLIFASLCKAVTTKPIAVYGDDLVVPTSSLEELYELMQFFGFQINRDKSFTEGPFRESCGSDWFSGIDVTPFYLRASNSLKIELVHIVNGLAAKALPDGKVWKLLRDLVREENLPAVPFNESSISGVWIDTHTAYTQKLITQRGFILRFKAFTPHSKTKTVADSRTRFLWHLDASRRAAGKSYSPPTHPMLLTYSVKVRDAKGATSINRSMVPLFTHKYKRKWVHWNPPVQATPVHMYMWTEYLTRECWLSK